jgi:hypothetical protein
MVIHRSLGARLEPGLQAGFNKGVEIAVEGGIGLFTSIPVRRSFTRF